MKRSRKVFAVLLLLASSAFAARAQQFWFAAQDTVDAMAGGRPNPLAYMDLFTPDAPWKESASHLNVFKLPAQFITQSTDEQLQTVFHDMERRHIKMAVEMGAVLSDGTCGGGEGYMDPAMVDRLGKRMQKFHLALDYMAMDEPVWMAHVRTWGRSKKGLADCHYSLEETVSRVAQTIAHMRTYFPALQVGWIDVVANRAQPKVDFRKVAVDYAEFAKQFARATGTPLAFFHCDIAWQDDWQPLVVVAAKIMRAQGISFGVIIGGTRDDATDEAFVGTGLKFLKTLEANPATHLDDVIVQSWQPRPTKFLPESDPGTSTYLLLQTEKIASAAK